MDKSELSNQILMNLEKSITVNREQIMKDIYSLSNAIHPNKDLDQLFFNFYMSAVHTGITASMETLSSLGFLSIPS